MRVLIDAKTVVRGHPRDGEHVQVVGTGSTLVRARYVAFWRSPAPALRVSGTIGAAEPLGFELVVSGRSASVTVVLSSSTLTEQPLYVGEAVEVSGSGSLARGIVASRVAMLATPSPSPSPTPSPKPTATPTTKPTLAPIYLQPGNVTGQDNLFKPYDGDTPSGGQNQQSVDGIPCAPTHYVNNYHVHIYVGILVNGNQVAIPDQIGLYNPGPVSEGFTESAQCYYFLHTHDASGIVHVESPSTAPLSSTLFELKNFFDIWGITVGPQNVGPFNGQVRTFVATVPLKTLTASSYAEYTGDPNAIQLYSHEAIWLEVGPTFVVPPMIPNVTFYTEY
ncbi:MAG: hypothetical protein JO092_06860 [Candidatus Eremiobacteraeota bacterium]|nr:hypothetical protein [Candidatus Eremiobacteraeota bacterium]